MGAGLRATYPYLWFKYACVCSWLILTICFVMMITAAAAVSHLSDIASNVCAEPEIKMGIAAAESLRGKSCKEALECFASCVDDTPLVTSNRMGDCFLATAVLIEAATINMISRRAILAQTSACNGAPWQDGTIACGGGSH